MLTSKTLPPRQKLMLYEMAAAGAGGGGGGGCVTKRLLRHVGITEEEYKQLRPGGIAAYPTNQPTWLGPRVFTSLMV